MKYIIFLIMFSILSACHSNQNAVLEGEWEIDVSATLRLLNKTSEYSSKIIDCYMTKLCGNTKIIFLNGYAYTILRNAKGEELSTEKNRYKFKKTADEYIIDFNNTDKKHSATFDKINLCINIMSEELNFYECYKRIKK